MCSRGIMQHLENKECAENYPRTVCNCLLAYFTNLRRKMLINANPKSAEVPTGHRQRIATPSTIYILHRSTQKCFESKASIWVQKFQKSPFFLANFHKCQFLKVKTQLLGLFWHVYQVIYH